ncbi:MAG: hypothetical protein E7Z88_08465 [Cyanobacteria bacterium SIG27]|nr:hypothetical protein [Cyanobacteria bacterium SIG27]MBQ9149953.1 hypothetical protein [bacterium]
MFDFLTPKNKLQAWAIRDVAIESFEIIGIGQINPYCESQYENEIFLTVVNFANDARNYDEREGLILTKYFTVKKCPKCKKIELIPIKLKINLDETYLRHEEEIAYDAFEEHPSRRHFSSIAAAFCNHCSTCFEVRIKTKDCWVKEAKKIKERDLINSSWEEYCLE